VPCDQLSQSHRSTPVNYFLSRDARCASSSSSSSSSDHHRTLVFFETRARYHRNIPVFRTLPTSLASSQFTAFYRRPTRSYPTCRAMLEAIVGNYIKISLIKLWRTAVKFNWKASSCFSFVVNSRRQNEKERERKKEREKIYKIYKNIWNTRIDRCRIFAQTKISCIPSSTIARVSLLRRHSQADEIFSRRISFATLFS